MEMTVYRFLAFVITMTTIMFVCVTCCHDGAYIGLFELVYNRRGLWFQHVLHDQ